MIKLKEIFAIAALSILFAQPVHAANYSVTSGDSLYIIGNVFKTTSDTIIKLNNLTSSSIYPGQALTVPGDTYSVQNGDSLYLIAKKFNVSISDLKRANNKINDYIYVGEKLAVPNGTLNNLGSNNNLSTPSTTPRVPYTASDLDLLSRLVTAEAENQPYTAKVAVAAVVLNRVKSSVFPNSISSVIYQKSDGYYQFTPVQNGWINKPASADAKKAAYEALYGNDPSHGAIYYFDDSATSKWLWSRPLATKIGKMVFAY